MRYFLLTIPYPNLGSILYRVKDDQVDFFSDGRWLNTSKFIIEDLIDVAEELREEEVALLI